jgi:uncharacterized protein YlxP (DUF503 family)
MVVGILKLEVHVPTAHSLKDKRSAVKGLRDQLRGRFNVAVAEVEPNEKWQRATLGISAIGENRAQVEELLRHVTEWIRNCHLVELIRIEQEWW